MQVYLEGARLRLGARDLLGVGGEAKVFSAGERAIKIYHPLDPADAQGLTARRRKIDKLRAFPAGLPAEVIAPRGLVTDKAGEVLGYAMQAVRGAEDVLRLSQRRWREGVVDAAEVVSLFLTVHDVLARLHARGVVVGDLNDSNLLFTGPRAWFIDADSMQFGAHACVVGHERFLDPRLYGADLAARPAFDAGSDWYAFAVMLFGSLQYVHPYGGMHRGYPTMLRRAEARVSVLHPEVVYPRAAAPLDALPEPLRAWFAGIFDQGRREPPSRALLERVRYTRCACGLEHARAGCPRCAAPGVAVPAVRSAGRCRAKTVFRARGRILAVSSEGGLAYVYLEGGVVRREDGSEVLAQPPAPGMRFAIAGPSTFVGHEGRLIEVQRGRLRARTSTGRFGARTVFDASAAGCLRTEGDWLVDHGSGARMGQILDGATLIWTGARLALGVYRAGLVSVAFLARRGRAGLTRLALPPILGRLVDASCAFDDRHALLCVDAELDGRLTRSLFLVREDGAVLACAQGAPESARMLASRDGKVLVDGRVVCATEEGLLSLGVDAGRFVESRLFPDSQAFVGAGVELYPAPSGALYVVGADEIVHLSLI